MYAHLDHDTQPDHIIKRIENLIPEGRTLFIATDEMQPHFFDKLSSKYAIFPIFGFRFPIWCGITINVRCVYHGPH